MDIPSLFSPFTAVKFVKSRLVRPAKSRLNRSLFGATPKPRSNQVSLLKAGEIQLGDSLGCGFGSTPLGQAVTRVAEDMGDRLGDRLLMFGY